MSKPAEANPSVAKDLPACTQPKIPQRDLSQVSNPLRARLISLLGRAWVNGTELNYYFFTQPAQWVGGEDQMQAVREAFQTWKDLGIGLTFREVTNPAEAQIRIGFDQTDGSWSYVGRDAIDYASSPDERTMNFGWDLTTPYGRDTALHEIGHALSFPHEHQNPKAGIVWHEDKVYSYFAAPPNNWDRDTTYWNIIRKIEPNDVDGSNWDRDSIMHYQFAAGLIAEPPEYETQPLIPAPGLSQTDIDSVRLFYPPLETDEPQLEPYVSERFDIAAGQQLDFVILPQASRSYTMQTFGQMDTVMVLFERRDGFEEYIDGDDDGGTDFNAKITAHLSQGREYILRIRLYYTHQQGGGAVLLF